MSPGLDTRQSQAQNIFVEPNRLDELLPLSAGEPDRALPNGFAQGVIRRARQIQTAARRHWRTLMASSLLALALASGIGWAVANQPHPPSPPPFKLFEPAPFPLP